MAPIDVLSRFKAFYTRAPPIQPPTIWPSTAAVLSAGFTLLYVLPLYLSSSTRPSPTLGRDSPSVIRARIRTVVLSSLLSAALTVYLIKYHHNASTAETLRLLGWWPTHPIAIAQTLLLCSILFAGPLFECGLVEGGLSSWLRGTHTGETSLSTWTGRRNLIAGPVTEELVFRSLIVPLHLMARVPASRIVFLTPLYFGIAHVHHFYEFVLSHPNFPLFPAVVRTLVQFTYTSLFGFFATFVFLRTGSVYAAIAAHVFCNWMGLPRFWGRVGAPARVERRGRNARSNNAGESSEEDVRNLSKKPQGSNLSAILTVIYYSLLVAGLYGFSKELWPLTQGAGSLAEFGNG